MKTILFSSLVALFLVSCQTSEFQRKFGKDAPAVKATVTRIHTPIILDGKLDETVWQQAPAYPLAQPAKSHINNENCPKRNLPEAFQPATARLLVDGKYLYIGIQATDTDVMQQGEHDQQLLFGTGDTIEIFLKSKWSPRYHEIYATPANLKTTLFCFARYYPRNDAKTPYPGYKIAAQVHGTLNNQQDEDKGWDVEIAIPLDMMETHTGIPFDEKGAWSILVARYNYNYTNPINADLSSFPQLPIANYHLWEYFANIQFAKSVK